MSQRFQRLELDGEKKTSSPSQLSGQLNLQSDLHDAAYWMHQADGHRRHGRFEEALRDYSRGVEQDRSVVRGWVGQIQMLIAMEEYPEAELWARKALELFRGHADLSAARAQALCRRGDITQAQAACDAAIGTAGISSYPWTVRGELMLSLRDPVEEYCFDKAVQIDTDWLVLIEIAGIYIFYRRHAKALSYCRRAVQKTGDHPYCWFRQGECELAMGLNDAARLSFKQCLDLEPKNMRARKMLEELQNKGWHPFGWLRRK
ncbi:MAG TPA: tetratricopeptide repeat protein [Tepidisphaeraceae bacterium]|jgi:tetratricopeptide (TPR) repeat protein